MSNNMTMQGAEKLARNIKQYWGMQGYEIKTWVHAERDRTQAGAVGGMYIYEVKTDLINGLPRNWKGKVNGRT